MKGEKTQLTIVLTSNTAFSLYKFRAGLIANMISAGHTVVCLANADEYVTNLQALGCRFEPIHIANRGVNPFSDLLICAQYCKHYWQLKPNLIINYTIKPTIYSSIVAGWFKIPFISVITGLGSVFIKANWLTKIATILYRLSQRSAKKILFLNSEDLKFFLDHNIVNQDKTALLPSEGVDTNEFPLTVYPAAVPTINFLFLGRLLVDKGFLDFLAAAKAIKHEFNAVRFLVVGRAENKDVVLGKQLKLAIEQNIIEYIGYAYDTRPYISKAHCIVLPSYREGISKTLLEAAAMGRPIIASDVPGCREVVVHGSNGYLCQARNIEDLAEKLRCFMHLSHAKRYEMGVAGYKKIAEQFAQQQVIACYHRIFRELRITV